MKKVIREMLEYRTVHEVQAALAAKLKAELISFGEQTHQSELIADYLEVVNEVDGAASLMQFRTIEEVLVNLNIWAEFGGIE